MKKIEQFQETERKLMDSYEKLLISKSKISVDMICEEANLHHQTFYRHFKNKDEFFVYFITTKLNNLINENDSLSTKDFSMKLLEYSYSKSELINIYLKDPTSRKIISTTLCHYFAKKIVKEYKIDSNGEIFFLNGGILYYIIQCVIHNDVIKLENAELILSGIFMKLEKMLEKK